MGLFNRKPGEWIDVAKFPAEIEARVSRLEDNEYERNAIAGGAVMIAGRIFKRGDPVGSWAWISGQPKGVIAGTPSEMRAHLPCLHLSCLQAESLRDWLLKEFPLEKPATKKKGK